ncbi:MAG: dienelactone hydrolase family protein [Opitutaceae bacterium]
MSTVPSPTPASPVRRLTAQDFDQELLDLYDYYAHGRIDRRTFIDRAGKYAVGGLTAAALLEMMSPQYAFAAQVPKDDARVTSETVTYRSPEGHGEMRGLLARPAGVTEKRAGVLVVHENRGLNPYIEDVTRRLALAGFVAFAPDALTPLGGYPGTDDEGRTLQAKLDRLKVIEDFVAGARFLQSHRAVNGSLGVVGFCFGGGMANTLAWRLPELVKAAVPYYGGQPKAEEAALIKGALLLHYAELDTRVNAGWPAYEAALKAAGVRYEAHVYPKVNHGFHNDTTPRYDKAAAELSWERTLAFFHTHLG